MPGRTLGDVGKGVLPANIFCCRSKNDLYIKELSANLTRKSDNLEKYKITKYNTSGEKKIKIVTPRRSQIKKRKSIQLESTPLTNEMDVCPYVSADSSKDIKVKKN